MFDAAELRETRFAAVPETERAALLHRQAAYAAAHSAYYAEALAGLEAPETLSELARLPFLTPETLMAQGRRLVCVPASEIARVVSLHTSGSSGKAKRLYFTRGDLMRTVDFFTEGMRWMTAPGDRVAVLMPCGVPDGIGELLCRALSSFGAQPLPLGARADLAAVGRELSFSPPDVLVGFPWQLRLLALLCPQLRPHAALLSADYVPETLPALLREIWGCTPLQHFGMTETGCGCAVEHPCAPGMVLRADELLAEIVEPESGAPLPPGQAGELVLTTLRREAMPLLRYRTGDRAVLDESGRIRRVFGRLDVPRDFYTLQDRLCALRWLYDFSLEDGRLTVLAAPDAPADSASVLAEAAGGLPFTLLRGSAESAALLHAGKRPLPKRE